jgi:hypothetical protein
MPVSSGAELTDQSPSTARAVVFRSAIARDISESPRTSSPGVYPGGLGTNVSSGGRTWNHRASNEEGRSGMYIGGGVILLIIIIILLIWLL